MNFLKDLFEAYKILYHALGWLVVATSPILLMFLINPWFGLLFIVTIPVGAVIFVNSVDKL